jgi:hypothetical protein
MAYVEDVKFVLTIISVKEISYALDLLGATAHSLRRGRKIRLDYYQRQSDLFRNRPPMSYEMSPELRQQVEQTQSAFSAALRKKTQE